MAKEPIIIKEVTYSGATRPKIAMYSCAECVVTDVAIGYENITGHEELQKVKIYHMEVTTDLGESLSLRRIHEDDWLRVEDFFKSFKRWILDLHPSERRSFWKDFYRLQEDFTLTIKGNKLLPRLQYAYAVTVHQSQGSTFNNVYADYSNIMGCAQDPKMRNQLLYVACSRASENLFLRSKF